MYWNSGAPDPRLRIAPPAPAISNRYSSLDNSFRPHNEYDPAFPLDGRSSASSGSRAYDFAEERNTNARLSSHDNSSMTTHQPNINSSSFNYERYSDNKRIDQDDYYERIRENSDRLSDSHRIDNLRLAPPSDFNEEELYFRRPGERHDEGFTNRYDNVTKPTITDNDINEYLESRRHHDRLYTDDDVVPFRRGHHEDSMSQSGEEFTRRNTQQAVRSSSTQLANTIDDRFIQTQIDYSSQQHGTILLDQTTKLQPPKKENQKEKVVSQYIVLHDIPEEGRQVDFDSPIPHALFRRKVTHVDGVIGFAGTDLFFQMSKVTGPALPQIGSLVLIKAEKVQSMPFQWSALTVDLVSMYPPKDDTISSAVVPTKSSIGKEQDQGHILETIPLNLPSTNLFDSRIKSLVEERPLKSILKNKAPPPPIISHSAILGGSWRNSTPSPKRDSPEIIIEKLVINKRKRSPSHAQRRTAPVRSPSPRRGHLRGTESTRPPRRGTSRSRSKSPRRKRSRSNSPRRRRRSRSNSPRRRRSRSNSPRRRRHSRSNSPRRRRSKSPLNKSHHSWSRSPTTRLSSSSSKYRRDRGYSRSRSRSPVLSTARRRSRSRSPPTGYQLGSIIKDHESRTRQSSPPKSKLSPKRIVLLDEKNDRISSQIAQSSRPAPLKKPSTPVKKPVASVKKPVAPVSFTWSTKTVKSKLSTVGKNPSSKKPKEQPKAFTLRSDNSRNDERKELSSKDEETKKKITTEIVKNIQQVREKLKNDQFKITTQVTGDANTVVPNPLFSSSSAVMQPALLHTTNVSGPPSAVPYRHDVPFVPNLMSQQQPQPFYPPQGPYGPGPMPVAANPGYLYPQQQGPTNFSPQQEQYRGPPLPLMNTPSSMNPPFMPPVNTNVNYYQPPYIEPTHVRRTTVLTPEKDRHVQKKTFNNNNITLRPSTGNLVLLKNPWSEFNSKVKELVPPGEESSKTESSKALSKTTSFTGKSTNSSSAGTNDNTQNSMGQLGPSSDSSSTVDSVEFGCTKVKSKKKKRKRKRFRKRNVVDPNENWDIPKTTTIVQSKSEREENWDIPGESNLNPSFEASTKLKSQQEVQVNYDDDEICVISVAPSSFLFEEEYGANTSKVDSKLVSSNKVAEAQECQKSVLKKKTTTTRTNSAKAIITTTTVKENNSTTVIKKKIQSQTSKTQSSEAAASSASKETSKDLSTKIDVHVLKSWEEERLAIKAKATNQVALTEKNRSSGSSIRDGDSFVNSKLSDKLTDIQKKRLLEKEKESRTVDLVGTKFLVINQVKPETEITKFIDGGGGNNRVALMDVQLAKNLPPYRLANSMNTPLPIPTYSSGYGGSSISSFRSDSPGRLQQRHHHHQISQAALDEPIVRISRRRSLSPSRQHQSMLNTPFVDPMKVVAVKQLEIRSLELRDRELQYEMQRLMVERKCFNNYSSSSDQERYF